MHGQSSSILTQVINFLDGCHCTSKCTSTFFCFAAIETRGGICSVDAFVLERFIPMNIIDNPKESTFSVEHTLKCLFFVNRFYLYPVRFSSLIRLTATPKQQYRPNQWNS